MLINQRQPVYSSQVQPNRNSYSQNNVQYHQYTPPSNQNQIMQTPQYRSQINQPQQYPYKVSQNTPQQIRKIQDIKDATRPAPY